MYSETIIASIFGSTLFIVGSLVWFILILIGQWRIFTKAGYEGWKCIIPLYNIYILYKISLGEEKGWMFLLLLIPCVMPFLELYRCFKLAEKFGVGSGFGIGLWLLPGIFTIILGFGESVYTK